MTLKKLKQLLKQKPDYKWMTEHFGPYALCKHFGLQARRTEGSSVLAWCQLVKASNDVVPTVGLEVWVVTVAAGKRYAYRGWFGQC